MTSNFDLTVRRVSKVLRNLHCYPFVVKTKEIEVWCAAGGGKYTASQVISAIEISGNLVDHYRLVLPQFCAPGVGVRGMGFLIGWSLAVPVLSALIGFDLAGGTPLWRSETGTRFKKMRWTKILYVLRQP